MRTSTVVFGLAIGIMTVSGLSSGLAAATPGPGAVRPGLLDHLPGANETSNETDETWTGDVALDAGHVVPVGHVLTVGSGTRVHGAGWLKVYGELRAVGSLSAPVTFETNVTLAGPAASSSRLEGVHFKATPADHRCLLGILDGANAVVESSRFENGSGLLCIARAAPRVFNSTFLYGGFGFESFHGQTLGAPGERGVCWEVGPGRGPCRGEGGTTAYFGAVYVYPDSSPTLQGNRFVSNSHALVFESASGATVKGNLFEDNDVAVSAHFSKWAFDQVEKPLSVFSDNKYLRNGCLCFQRHREPDSHPNPSIHDAAMELEFPKTGNVRPERALAQVVLSRETFEENDVGLSVVGWDGTVAVDNSTFRGNGAGVRTYYASAIIERSTFADSRPWDLYLGGPTGYVVLRDSAYDQSKVWLQEGVTLETDWGILVGAGFGLALLGGFVGLTEAGRWVLFKVVFWSGYSRVVGPALLDHAVRDRMVAIVQHDPGLHLRELRRRAGVPYGAAVYHLTRLERERLLVSRRDGFYRRFYPPGGVRSAPEAELAPIQRRLLDHVRRNPGCTQTQAARALGCSKQLAGYHARQLILSGRLSLEAFEGRKRLMILEPGPAIR